MANKEWKCGWCGIVITTTGSTPGPKMGGPCTKASGNHSWRSA